MLNDINTSSYHTPIMLPQVLSLLRPERGGTYVDGTLGGGGHSLGILRSLPAGGRLFGIDRDGEAIAEASARLSVFPNFTAVRGNFFQLTELLNARGVNGADGILLDLGVSSHQLDDAERGFSYGSEARLDMRMDKSAPLSAHDVVNGYDTAALTRIIRDYGEERFASRISNAIGAARADKPIETTTELAEIIKNAIPAAARRDGPHPARRTFQAIRIEVNGELAGLEQAVRDAIRFLNPGGVIAVITFHSLEDRIVKNVFKNLANPCTCPPNAPVCVCGLKPEVAILTKKPLVADDTELDLNSRSRSAKLRAAQKLIHDGGRIKWQRIQDLTAELLKKCVSMRQTTAHWHTKAIIFTTQGLQRLNPSAGRKLPRPQKPSQRFARRKRAFRFPSRCVNAKSELS